MPVRPARRDEVGDIAELWEELVAYHQMLDPALPVAAPDGVQRYAREIMSRINNPESAVFVAVNAQGVIVGYALVLAVDLVPDAFVQQQGGFLADIYVQPRARRQGFGRALYNAVVTWCYDRGLHTLEWDVAANNPTGRAFWRAMGGNDLMVRMRASVVPSHPEDNDSGE